MQKLAILIVVLLATMVLVRGDSALGQVARYGTDPAAPAGGDGKVLDGTGAGQADVIGSAPVGTEQGLVVRIAGGGASDGKILDGTAAGEADVISSAPAGTEQALVTRNIPSGTQPISGTLTCNAGTGTFTVGDGAGSLTVDGTATVTQGTAAAGSGAWPTSITNTADTVVKPGDAVNNAVRVNVVAGSAAGTASFEQSGGADQEARVYDSDLGAGSEFTAGVVLRKSVSGGSVEAGTAADPLRVDVTGTTTQPVSGTLTCNAGSGTFNVGDGAGPLSVDGALTCNAGTGTFTVSDGTGPMTVDGTVTANAGTGTFLVGDGTGALTVDGTVSGTGTFLVGDGAGALSVDGTVTANAGTGTFTVGGTVTANAGTGTFTVSDGTGPMTVDGTTTCNAGTGTFAVSGTVTANAGTGTFAVGDGAGALTVDGNVNGKVVDGSAAGEADVLGSAPAGTEQALVTRNIPSGTQPVSGTVTANAGTGTFTVSDGSGNMTVDGTVTANAGTGTFTVGDGTGALTVDGTVTSNAGTGTFTVGGVAAADAAASGNPVLLAGYAEADAAALTAVSAEGDVSYIKTDLQGRVLTNGRHPFAFFCNQSAVTATTQCQAAPGASLSLYVTGVTISSTDAKRVKLVYGTGTNCATGTTNLTAEHYVPASGGFNFETNTPYKVPANTAVCCAASAATAFSCDVRGYTAP